MTTLPKLSELDWDMNNMLSFSSTQYVNAGTPERTYYVYDHSGNRVRKVTESAARPGEEPRKQRDTLFLSGVELQVRNNGSDLWIARVTGVDIIAMVEVSSTRQNPLVRFQTGGNMELDDQAQLVSYEEHSPFGAVVYSAVYGEVEAPRTYRFAKYEHDHETGLYHCERRYYCPWLGRWTSPDPLGDVDGPNLYEYVNNDPVNSYDPQGTSKKDLLGTSKKDLLGTSKKDPAYKEKRDEDNVEHRKATRDNRINDHRKKMDASLTAPIPAAPESLQEGKDNMTKLLADKPPELQLHHVYPVEFKKKFEDIGIKVNDFTVSIQKELHDICTYSSKGDIELDSWNNQWKQMFFNNGPTGYDAMMET